MGYGFSPFISWPNKCLFEVINQNKDLQLKVIATDTKNITAKTTKLSLHLLTYSSPYTLFWSGVHAACSLLQVRTPALLGSAPHMVNGSLSLRKREDRLFICTFGWSFLKVYLQYNASVTLHSFEFLIGWRKNHIKLRKKPIKYKTWVKGQNYCLDVAQFTTSSK